MNRLIEMARILAARGGLNNYEKLKDGNSFARCGKHSLMTVGTYAEILETKNKHIQQFPGCKLDLTINNSLADFKKWKNDFNYQVVGLGSFTVPDAG